MSPRKPFARLQWDGPEQPDRPPARLEKVLIAGLDPDPPNRLFLGDNLAVMQALAGTYEGRIDLIYADPPFLTGKAYAARVGRGEDSRRPEGWHTIEGYDDTWDDGAEYLSMLHARLIWMHRLLAPHGSLYLHLDWHAAAYARVLLDEIFGPDRLVNEIIWTYHGPSPIRSAFNRKHDTLLLYTKSKQYTFNADAVRMPYSDTTLETFASSPKAGFGKMPDLARGKVPEDWWYFPVVARLHSERTGYPTQKPEALLERMILASSNDGDWVADFFCGSGTTPLVAGRLGRRWLACDAAPLAVQTCHRRLVMGGLAGHSFEVQSEWRRPPGFIPQIDFERHDEQITIRLIGLKSEHEATPNFPDDLVLWEIDPDFDQACFQAVHHKARPWRSEQLELAMQIDRPGSEVAVRVVDRFGGHGWAQITVPL
jgi:DNA modification methylase